ncbi:MAG: phosphonate ABC transporter ATP-binding protein [Sideroxyarcus sp.]|nr:phosphonate ABC transporter ATP-binding protein [Sideroxyarcus sp.]
MEFLRIAGLAKRFGAAEYALAPTDLVFGRGQFVAVIGPSGAGKTTFLRCMNRMIEPSEGKIFINGQCISSMCKRELRQRIAMVFQQPNLVPRLSALDNVLIGRLGFMVGRRALFPCFRHEDRMKALTALDRVGMLEYAVTPCVSLSGGQQQRVAIARALAQEAEVLLADEPVASLDPENAAKVMELLMDINQQDGVTVLVNLHQIDLARKYANTIVAFKAGRMVFYGTGEEFMDEHYRRVFVAAAS